MLFSENVVKNSVVNMLAPPSERYGEILFSFNFLIRDGVAIAKAPPSINQ